MLAGRIIGGVAYESLDYKICADGWIIETEIIEQWNVRNDPVCVMVKYLCQSQNSNKYILDSDDFCFDYECAIKKAEEMPEGNREPEKAD